VLSTFHTESTQTVLGLLQYYYGAQSLEDLQKQGLQRGNCLQYYAAFLALDDKAALELLL